jgi:hypothetical protein
VLKITSTSIIQRRISPLQALETRLWLRSTLLVVCFPPYPFPNQSLTALSAWYSGIVKVHKAQISSEAADNRIPTPPPVHKPKGRPTASSSTSQHVPNTLPQGDDLWDIITVAKRGKNKDKACLLLSFHLFLVRC